MNVLHQVARPFKTPAAAEGVHGKDMWLDNDDVRPLKLKDRTWTATTYFTFWFSAASSVSLQDITPVVNL